MVEGSLHDADADCPRRRLRVQIVGKGTSRAALGRGGASASREFFGGVAAGARCAIEARNGMVERNAGVTEDRPTEFRVDIHLGDVVEQRDGVNIAVGYARKASTTLASDRVGTTRAKSEPRLDQKDCVFALSAFLPSHHHQHRHIQHLASMRSVARWQHHLDDQQRSGWLHGFTTVPENSETLILAPVVNNMRQDVNVAPVGR